MAVNVTSRWHPVVNASYKLEDYALADVLHYERFHNGEVMAGNYILTNSAFSRKSRRG